MAAIFCDLAGIGKTHACKEFARSTSESFYMNCSDHTTKSSFVRGLARILGLESKNKIEETLQNCIHFINNGTKMPLLILDEAGDLNQAALLMLKRIYNATEFKLALYVIGARGLEHSLAKGVRLRKNGYEEVWSRLTGGKEKAASITPEYKPKLADFMRKDAELICKANGVTEDADLYAILDKNGDQRMVRREIMKLRHQNPAI